eukprot:10670155-Alexandrium_andersonii.AAC.1
MGHSQLDGELGSRPLGLLREVIAEGNSVGEEGGLRASHIQLMPAPPWDKRYDLWGLGPDLAVIHEQPSRQ